MSDSSIDPVRAVALKALELVKDGAKVGLGSGRASHTFIRELGVRVQQGLRVQGVPTSDASEKLARELNIPLIELAEGVELDLTVDGADEVAPNLDLIKGWGGALVRERIVAAASRQQIILVGAEKRVQTLGERGRIPVEIIPLAKGFVSGRLKKLGLTPTVRLSGGNSPFISDNGNLTLDCKPERPLDPHRTRELERAILDIAGVVDTGMFLGIATQVLVGETSGAISVMTRH